MNLIIPPRSILWLCLVTTAATPAAGSAQSRPERPADPGMAAEMPAAPESFRPPAFKSLRSDEDYSYLRDPAKRTDFWDPIKYIPLGRGDAFLTLGGEVRERYEFFRNPAFGGSPTDARGDNDYLLQRYMLHADARFGPDFRSFVQMKSGLKAFGLDGPRGIDVDRLDLHQAFFDWRLPAAEDLTLRVGRQEMSFGSSRLVSVREGPNVRQSFDAVRGLWHTPDVQLDAFVSRPVETKRGVFDDGSNRKQAFWGVYGVVPTGKGRGVDLYYLGLSRDRAEFAEGTADERRHTVGTRVWGTGERWDHNVEAVYQFGEFGPGTINAWSAATSVGRRWEAVPWKPRLAMQADIASGDRRSGSGNLQSFNALFPKGAYFNEADAIGPSNLIDLHPILTVEPRPGLVLAADCDFFWRQSLGDGLYAFPLELNRPPGGSRARYIGSAPTVRAEWQATRHLLLVAEYTHFFAGPFLRQTGPGGDLDFFAVWMQYKF